MNEKRTLIRECQGCKKSFEINVHEKDVVNWMNGTHIQTAMPYLKPGERELLISGFCGTCYDDLFVTI